MIETTNQRIARRVMEMRKERRMRQSDLASRLTELGGLGWNQSKVAKLERGDRKNITIDDLLLLALALDTTPLFLLAPPAAELDIAGKPFASEDVRQWFRGYAQLPGQDYGRFWSTAALMEPQAADRIREALEAHAREQSGA